MALTFDNPQFRALTATPKARTYTVAVATAVIVILLIFFANRPAIISIFNRVNENKQKKEVLEQLDQKYNSLIQLNDQEQREKDKFEILEVALPNKAQEEFVIANVYEMIKIHRLDLLNEGFEDIDPESVAERDNIPVNIGVSVFSVTVEGRREDVVSFVKDLESFPRILNIQKMIISPSQTQGLVRTTIETEVYYNLE